MYTSAGQAVQTEEISEQDEEKHGLRIKSWAGSGRSQFNTKTKIKIFKYNVLSVLFFGCKTWQMTKADEKKLDVFLYEPSDTKDLVANAHNKGIKTRAGIERISKQVARRR